MSNLLRVRTALNGWSGGPGLSTFYFDPGVATIDAAMVTGVTGRVRAYFDAWRTYMPSANTAQVESTADIVTVESGALVGTVTAGAAPSVVVGTGAGPGPAFVCGIGRLTTNSFIAGKRLRGRTYAGPLAAAYTDSVAPEGGFLAALQTGLNAVLASGGGPLLVVWHRPVSGSGGQIAAVVNVSTSPTYGVLKSRR